MLQKGNKEIIITPTIFMIKQLRKTRHSQMNGRAPKYNLLLSKVGYYWRSNTFKSSLVRASPLNAEWPLTKCWITFNQENKNIG